MSEFKPGEMAVYVGHPDKTRIHSECRPYVGEECEVIRQTVHPFHRLVRVYEIRFKDGFEMFAIPEGLRKRRPPESYKDQFTPVNKSLDDIIRRLNDKEIRVKNPDREVVV